MRAPEGRPDPEAPLHPRERFPDGEPIFPLALDLRDEGGRAPEVGGIDRILSASRGRGTVVGIVSSPSPFDPGVAAALATAHRRELPLRIVFPSDSAAGPADPAAPVRPVVARSPIVWIPMEEVGASDLARSKSPSSGWKASHFRSVPTGAGYRVPGGGPAPDLAIVRGSLMDAGDWELARSASSDAPPVIVLDPFADGRFDGAALRRRPNAREPPVPGSSPFAGDWIRPILPFGFLPIARQRTLAQASLLYLLGIPGVAAVAIRPEPAEVVVEALALDRIPRLDPAMVRRIREAGASVRGAVSVGVPSPEGGPLDALRR